MQMVYCPYLDWCECYCRVPSGYWIDEMQSKGCVVHVRDYGTRVYLHMAEIWDPELNLSVEVRWCPKSAGIMPDDACHVKISNVACYVYDPAQMLWRWLTKWSFTYESVSRVDICRDFIAFPSGIPCTKFLRRVLNGSYRRAIRGTRRDVVQESWDRVDPNYMSWQSGDVLVRIYDKTLELRQVASPHKRAYISAFWIANGLINQPSDIFVDSVPHVWRLEFQITSSSKGWVRSVDGSFFAHDIDTYCSAADRLSLFRGLCDTYFRFYCYKRGVDAADAKRVVLFGDETVGGLHHPSAADIAKVDRIHRLYKALRSIERLTDDSVSDPWRGSLLSVRDGMLSVLNGLPIPSTVPAVPAVRSLFDDNTAF